MNDPVRPKHCFVCGTGIYVEVVQDYLTVSGRGPIVVPSVLILRCDKCGEECLPPESSDKIDRLRFPKP